MRTRGRRRPRLYADMVDPPDSERKRKGGVVGCAGAKGKAKWARLKEKKEKGKEKTGRWGKKRELG